MKIVVKVKGIYGVDKKCRLKHLTRAKMADSGAGI